MHDSNDKKKVRFYRVEYCVRKHRSEAAAHILINYPPSCRRFSNPFNCCFDRINEVQRDFDVAVRRTSGPPDDILPALRDEIHISSSNRVTHLQ